MEQEVYSHTGAESAGGKRYQVHVCTNRRAPNIPKPSCHAKGAEAVYAQFKLELERTGCMTADLFESGCLGSCELGCTVLVYPEDAFYCKVTAADVTEIVESHLLGGKVVRRLLSPRQRLLFDAQRP